MRQKSVDIENISKIKLSEKGKIQNVDYNTWYIKIHVYALFP